MRPRTEPIQDQLRERDKIGEAASSSRQRDSFRSSLGSVAESELFLLNGPNSDSLRATVQRLIGVARGISSNGLGELAAELVAQSNPAQHRAALVAAKPDELVVGLERLERWLGEGRSQHRCDGTFLGVASESLRVGFLFPGQGARPQLDGGACWRRFDCIQNLYGAELLMRKESGRPDQQSPIVTASLGGLRLLRELGIEGQIGLGHSLGEFSALHWAGVWDEAATLRLTAARSRAMNELGAPGAMAGIGVDAERVKSILIGEGVVIAAYNSPRQTVISGASEEVARVVARAQRKGWPATTLPFSHPFHSNLVAAVSPVLARELAEEPCAPISRPVVSTITGHWLNEPTDLKELLVRQLTSPVRFIEAVQQAEAKGVDLWVEVGPGQILSGLMADLVQTPVVSMDVSGRSLHGLLSTVGAAFVAGAPVRTDFLFKGRANQPFVVDWSSAI